MAPDPSRSCTAFAGSRRIASGALVDVAVRLNAALAAGETTAVLVFDDATSRPVELDLRGAEADVRARLAAGAAPKGPQQEQAGDRAGVPAAPRRPGRPRLGVVAREVTLLPRHWDWLNGQPGGASVALRRLVDEARHAHEGRDRVRQAQEAAWRFMSAMAGDRPGFEEASRSLFRGDGAGFAEWTASWPADIRDHARKVASGAFGAAEAGAGR